MKRLAEKYLEKWFNKSDSKPLILRGARQVGKSTLVQFFCKNNKIDLVELNLEKQKVKSFLGTDNFSIDKVIDEIELLTKNKITKNSLVFIDEIQEMPVALSKLRYFYEDRPEIKIIAAGSLLEAVIEKEKFSMPVGRVEYYNLGPMNFTEFLMAKGEEIFISQLNDVSLSNPASESLHLQAIDFLKEFFYVGGMPEAVKKYIETGDREQVRDIHKDLYRTFLDDIPKYSTNKLSKTIAEIFEKIPAQIGEDKILFSGLANTNSSVIRNCIDLLQKAGLVYKVSHCSCSGLPLKSISDSSIFKLFFLDVGIYNCVMGVSWSDLFYLKPEGLLLKGKIAEQFIAQHLRFQDPKNINTELFYWLRGKKKGAAEIDFVITNESKIFPIEVKSGATGKMRSLWQFVAEKKVSQAIKMDLKYRKNMRMNVSHKLNIKGELKNLECTLFGLPLYTISSPIFLRGLPR